jgi:hypothetical protein
LGPSRSPAWVGWVVAVVAWRDGAADASVAGPLVVASLPFLLVPAAIAVPGELGDIVFLNFPLTALAWFWIAIVWLRCRERRDR